MAEEHPYTVLGLTFGAEAEAKPAYERMRRIFGEGSSLVLGLYSDQYRRERLQLIEQAYRDVNDASKRQLLQELYKKLQEEKPVEPVEARNPRKKKDEALPEKPRQATPAPKPRKSVDELSVKLDENTVYTGALLKKIREEIGIDLGEIAQVSKISINNLRMLEEDRYSSLPAMVYVRGFVVQYAKHLGLNPVIVTQSYLSLMKEAISDEES